MFLQFSHFEKYNTGVMFLPWGYDFTMWGCSLALLLAFAVGPELYVTPIFGYTPTFLTEVTLYTSGAITSYPMIVWNIYK
jgi:ethanolaminephosphotransferase